MQEGEQPTHPEHHYQYNSTRTAVTSSSSHSFPAVAQAHSCDTTHPSSSSTPYSSFVMMSDDDENDEEQCLEKHDSKQGMPTSWTTTRTMLTPFTPSLKRSLREDDDDSSSSTRMLHAMKRLKVVDTTTATAFQEPWRNLQPAENNNALLGELHQLRLQRRQQELQQQQLVGQPLTLHQSTVAAPPSSSSSFHSHDLYKTPPRGSSRKIPTKTQLRTVSRLG